MNQKSRIGIAGLAVMGENLVLNMAGKGISVSVYNRTTERVDQFLAGRARGNPVTGCRTVPEFISSIERPRKVMMMVKAGDPVDRFIEQIRPHLEKGDIVIDGGNSHFRDTIRRAAALEAEGIHFIGTGVSGGEEGALKGPAIMPGGSAAAWPEVEPIFTAIAAKAPDGRPCCEWMGKDGAGHFVKMVHNGIEYGDMQLICEVYQIMKDLLKMSFDEMQSVFGDWNHGELNSYLIGITADILAYKDADGTPVLDRILDAAGQKGTGKWTVDAALDEGVPLSLIGEAVFARCISAEKQIRLQAARIFPGPKSCFSGEKKQILAGLEQALYCAKIISYTQGYALLQSASGTYDWHLDYAAIARIWRAGCIIRSVFLNRIAEAFTADPGLANLVFAPYFADKVNAAQSDLRRIVALAAENGIPVPCLSAALGYYDSLRTGRLPANLLQAQRDYFGAHTYERVDRPRGEFFHTNWTGGGGATTSTAYNK